MPAIVFPSSGQTVRVTSSNDITSNAASWYLNDSNILTTTQNTSTARTYTFDNDTINFGNISNVKFFTNNVNEIVYDTVNRYTITGSDESSSNFVSNYLFESNLINVSRATSQNRTLYFTNNTNLGTITKVRIQGPAFEQETDVVANTNNSITIAVPLNWPLSFVGFTFTVGRFAAALVESYSSDIAVTTNTNQLLTINKPVGFPAVGSTLFAIIPYGVQNLAPIAGVNSTLTNAVTFKTFNKFITPPAVDLALMNRASIKIVSDTIRFTPTRFFNPERFREPITIPARSITYTNSTSTLYTDLIRVTGRSGITSDFSNYYVLENNRITTTKSTSSFVTLYFNNPNNNQSLGPISFVRLISPRFDVTVSVQSFTTDSVTVADIFGFDQRDSNNATNDLFIRLGTNFPERSVSISNNNSTPLVERTKVTATALPHTLTAPKLSVVSPLRDSTVRIRHSDFRTAAKVVGETRLFRTEKTQRNQITLKEAQSLPHRTFTSSTFTATIFTDPILISGRSGSTTDFTRYYVYEDNQVTITRSTSSFVTLYFPPQNNSISLGNITVARLTGPKFDITVNVQSFTIDSITVADIFGFNNIQSSNSITDVYVRLGRTYNETRVTFNDVNRINLLAYKADIKSNVEVSISGNTKIIKDRYFSTIELPQVNSFRSIPSLRETINYQSEAVTVPTTSTTIFTNPINIGGTVRTTSTFVSYYINESNNLTTITDSTVTSTLIFDQQVPIGTSPPTIAKLFAYQIIDGVENLKYEITLPIVNVTPNTVTVAWAVYEYKLRVQLGSVVNVSGKTYTRYTGPLYTASINQQKFRTSDTKVFEVSPSGILRRQYEKLSSTPINFTINKFKQEIVIKGEGRTIPSRSTIVTTNTATILEPFAINVYGKTETTSTAVRWYYDEENILTTLPVGSNLVTLYFDGLPIYQRTSSPFIRLIAPNVNYDFVHPVVSFTIDSVTIQNTGFIPSVSGMYFYWARIRDTYSYVYSDVGLVPNINVRKFYNFYEPVANTATTRLTTLNKSLTKLSSSAEIPALGRTVNIPKLQETLTFGSKSVTSITSSTQLTFSTTPLPVYGITASSSTFVSYYINEDNTLVTLPTGVPLATLYLGNNPEYYKPLGSTVRIVNVNNGFDRQFNIVLSTVDSVTITNPGDLPSASGTVIYYGSVQISYPSVSYSNSNAVANILKNTVGANFFEKELDRTGQVKQSIVVKSEPIRINADLLNKQFTLLKSSIEVPKQDKFTTAPKIGESGSYQSPSYSITTSTELLYYNYINLGRVASTTTFVSYYTFESNTITQIVSTGSQKVFYFSENINPALNFSSVHIQGYRTEATGENVVFDLTFPIASVTTNTLVINYIDPLPDLLYRASLGKTFVTQKSNYSGNNSVSVVNKLKSSYFAEGYSRPQFSFLDKKITVLKDLQPNNNFSIGNYGQAKIKVAADRTYASVITVTTATPQLVYLEPVSVSGTDRSTSTFVSYFINESDIVRTFNSTSSLITLYFNRTVGVTSDYTVARFTNFINYDFTTTIVSVNSQSVTILNPVSQPLPNGGLTAYLGKVWSGQSYRNVVNDSALQIPTISSARIAIVRLAFLGTVESPSSGRLKSSIVLRSETVDTKISANLFRAIPQVRGDRTSEPHRIQSVTTSTSLVFDPTPYRVYATNLSTSTAVSWYLNDNDILTSYGVTTSTLQLFLGNLPNYLQAQARNTHVRLVNETGFNQQFSITGYTADSVSISLPNDFPNISTLLVYFGSLRASETYSWNDTNTVSKINFKWGNWHTHVIQDKGLLQKPIISVREHVDRTRTSFLQKPVTSLRSSIEVPKSNKADRGIVLRDTQNYPNRNVIATTATSIFFIGPFDATGKLGSSSTFVSSYIFDNDVISGFVDSATTATLYFSNFIAPLNDGYTIVRVQGFTTGIDLPSYESTFAISTFTNNTVSFNFSGILPGSRYRVFLGKPITTVNVNYTDSNTIPMVNRLKGNQGFSNIEIPRYSVLEKKAIVVKDFLNNLKPGQARSITKLVQDRSYSTTVTPVTYTTSTVFIDPVPISGTNRNQTNFVQDYINELTGIITVSNNTSSLITLYLAQNIGYTGQHDVVKIVRYANGSYVGNRFIMGNIEFEITYPIVSYTSSSVTIQADPNSFIDPNIRSLAAYFGSPYQQPSSLSYSNTSSLAVSNVNKLVAGTTGFTLEPYSSKFNVSAKAKGITVPITPQSLNKNITKVAQDNNRLQTGITLKSAAVVKDGYYPNLNTRTRTVTTVTTIVYESEVYRIRGTNLTTSSFVTNYAFDSDLISTTNKSASTITLYIGQLPDINPGLGLYVRITDNGSFNTTTQVLSRGYGSVVINEPVGLPNISTLFLYFGAMQGVETVNYTDTNSNIVDAFFTQTNARTSSAPVTPREMLHYATVAPSKYGRQITVYPRDLVSPLNLIPPKTISVTTSSGVTWKDPAFRIYGSNQVRQTDLSWYTRDANLFQTQPNTTTFITLYFGLLPGQYSAYLNSGYVRLVNTTLYYDQTYAITTSTSDSITINTPPPLPNLTDLRAYFGDVNTIETVLYNDQNIVATIDDLLTLNPSTGTTAQKVILIGSEFITLPAKFKSFANVKETHSLVNQRLGNVGQFFTQTSVVVTTRPTNPRENLALLNLAPGLRLNRTISYGVQFNDFGNNFRVSKISAPITVRSTPRLSVPFRIESADTATAITTGITASPKNILYYTNLAPGIRGGKYYTASAAAGSLTRSELGYSNRFLGTDQLLTPTPSFINDFEKLELKALPFEPLGNLNKSAISVKHIDTLFDKSGAIRMVPTMRADTFRPSIDFVTTPFRVRATPYYIPVTLSNTAKYSVSRNGDLSSFTTDKFSPSIKVVSEGSRFYGDQRIRIISYISDTRSQLTTDAVDKYRLTKPLQQIVETPGTSALGKLALTVRDFVDNIKVGKANFTSKLVTNIHYTPVTVTDKAKPFSLSAVKFDEQRGRLDTVNKLITSQLSTITSLVDKPYTKLAFTDNDYLIYTQKLGNLHKAQLKSFSIDDLGWLRPADFPTLQALDLDTSIGKVKPYSAINFAGNLDYRLSGLLRRLDRLVPTISNFENLGQMKISSDGVQEPLDIRFTVSPTGLITKFNALKSGNLQDPSTRRAVPVQFWN